MLGKLIKQEFKATARLLLPLYLILAVLTLMNRIVINLKVFKGALAIIPGLITFAYVISIISVVVVTFVFLIMRFYKNLITEEGYLMFTIPVKTHQLINAKLIVASLWTVASVVGVIASIFGLLITPDRFSTILDSFNELFREINIFLGNGTVPFFIEFLVLCILGLINNILVIYVSIAIGQLFNGHKVIGSFGAYMGINMVLQIVTTILLSIFGLAFRTNFNEVEAVPQIIFPIMIVFILLLNFLYFWVTDYIFKNKLNLE